SATGADNMVAQLAGFWIPNSYWGSLHQMEDGGHFLFLQITP
ncbi:unnamed protein product, partial [marine sediment metagenome]